MQGITKRVGNPEQWADSVAFLEEARQQGAAIFSVLRTQPFMRPFNWQRGTSLYDGVFHWRDLVRACRSPSAWPSCAIRSSAQQLRDGLDHPNTDGSKGSTLPPPPLHTVFVDVSAADPGAVGKSLAQLPQERARARRPTSCADLAVADGLETQFMWNNENDDWAEANADAQRNPHMIIGTGDGGAHADRDDGAEWSTYYIRSWLLDRQLFTLEEGIRRITHLPAMICGIKNRGLHRARLPRRRRALRSRPPAPRQEGAGHDMPGGEPRWQVRARGHRPRAGQRRDHRRERRAHRRAPRPRPARRQSEGLKFDR